MKIYFWFFLLTSQIAFSQERILVSPTNEVLPLKKGQAAISRITHEIQSQRDNKAACSNRYTFGYSLDHYPPTSVFGVRGGEALGQWYLVKASGTIDTIFWYCNGVTGAEESLVILRVFNSNIGPDFGPGIRPGPYNPPCQNWGYWVDIWDNSGIAPFREDAYPDTIWRSTYNGPVPSIPPFGNEIWGLVTGLGVIHRRGLNFAWLEQIGEPLEVVAGQKIFITMLAARSQWYWELRTDWAVWGSPSRVSTSDENYPSHNWKFYRTDSGPSNCAGIPKEMVERGWVARGPFVDDTLYSAAYNWWYSMTVTTNVPPVITAIPEGDPSNTFSTGQMNVRYNIIDCDPAHPESAFVASAVLKWSKARTLDMDFLPQGDIQMINMHGDLYNCNIPGQHPGTTVRYQVAATDINGMSSQSPVRMYKVVTLENPYYRVDTGAAVIWRDIRTTGTPIDTSRFFINNDIAGHGTAPKDDGTAGPFDIGGAFLFFGDTVRYAWVGVDGAIALSMGPTDTIDVNANGYWTPGWDVPQLQHHYRRDVAGANRVPPNFIAPLWADQIIGNDTGQYGRILYGNGGDSCLFIVEYDSIGRAQDNEATADITTYRIVLNRCDGTIEFQYANVGTGGLDSIALVAMQQDSTVLRSETGPVPGFVYLTKAGAPVETKPRNNWAVKFYPGAQVYAAGWSLLSMSTQPADYKRDKVYPGSCSDAFAYSGSYLPCPQLSNGHGYWLKFCNPGYAGVPGHPLLDLYDTVSTGWNMIGAITRPVSTGSIIQSSPGLVTSAYFKYGVAGYDLSPELTPGLGFWVRVNATGTLHLIASEELPKNPVSGLEQLNKVTILDNGGGVQTLYFGEEGMLNSPLATYEMPPAAPGFNVRFASGRIVETYPHKLEKNGLYEYPILVQSGAYPLLAKWEILKSAESKIALTAGGEVLGWMEGRGSARISKSGMGNMAIRLSGDISLPRAFGLSQNYPNPFNPATKMTYSIPVASNVSLKVYDILGREVAVLASGRVQPGRYTLDWEAQALPSGVYFLKMEAAGVNNPGDAFKDVKKLVLMR